MSDPVDGNAGVFTAVLTPPHALSRAGFLLLMAGIVAISAGAGLGFYLVGAWPVIGFLGLDVVLVYAALRAYARGARAREVVELTRESLLVSRFAPDGGKRMFEFDPGRVRVELRDHPDGSNVLALASRGRRLIIATCLGAGERREFAAALCAALAAQRI